MSKEDSLRPVLPDTLSATREVHAQRILRDGDPRRNICKTCLLLPMYAREGQQKGFKAKDVLEPVWCVYP